MAFYSVAVSQHMPGMKMPKKQTTQQTQKVIYTCPMHPEVQMSKPGDCPKCGMTLEKKTIKVTASKKALKTTAPKITSAKKQSSSTTKTTTTSNGTVGNEEAHEILTEMKDMMQEMKNTVAEMKGIVKELKGTTSEAEADTTDEHKGHGMNINNAGTAKPVTKATYTCPMHPEIHASKPGNCPKCGMKLVIEKTKSPTQPATYTCPMHPEIHATKPGNCPKCGMKLVPEKTQSPSTQATTYTCPMHPEVKRDKPGNCPKCGMKLVKEKSAGNTNMHDMEGMQMNDGSTTMENIMMAKKNLGPIKTITSKVPSRTVVYHLYIRDTTVTFGKKPKRAIAVNGQIPMPTLTFTEGDTAEIWVHNELKEKTSLHWHGLFVPNKMDGVPYLTQMPIKPGQTYLYKFPIVQHGTHWYHSHSGLQEQIGMYGAFIMNKRSEWDIPTIPVLLSEWIDMKSEEVHRSLHAATDWFAVQKGATQSYSEAIKKGRFKTKVANEWKRMNAMDLTDVYYDNFLINGKNQNEQPQFKAGDKVRLRIANGGASDYFWLSYSGVDNIVVQSICKKLRLLLPEII